MTRRAQNKAPVVAKTEEVVTMESQVEVSEGELNEILANAPKVDLNVEEAVAEPLKEETSKKGEKEPFSVIERKLRVHESFVLDVPYGTEEVTIENVGGGDLYADCSTLSYSQSTIVPVGEIRKYSGVEKVFIGAASRPTFRASFYK